MFQCVYHILKRMFSACYNVFYYHKWQGRHCVTSTGTTSTQFRVQPICYTIISDKQILLYIKSTQSNTFTF
jgi:hypothetical protein